MLSQQRARRIAAYGPDFDCEGNGCGKTLNRVVSGYSLEKGHYRELLQQRGFTLDSLTKAQKKPPKEEFRFVVTNLHPRENRPKVVTKGKKSQFIPEPHYEWVGAHY